MALQQIPGQGIVMSSLPKHVALSSSANATLDAAGESTSIIGNIVWASGTGSKTLSAAGAGKIIWRSGTPITFANAGTNVRVGVNDINASGVEDGTHDVYADLVGGTDVIAANTVFATTMEVGTKTMNYGDVIAIVVEMTTRAGADSVLVSRGTTNTSGAMWSSNHFPYATTDSGAGPAKGTSTLGGLSILFDDGTVGWIAPLNQIRQNVASAASVTYAANSTPDEYGVRFRLPFKCSANACTLGFTGMAATDTWEAVIYTDPDGTPVAAQTITVDPDYIGSTGTQSTSYYRLQFTSAFTFDANTWYCLSVRPTSNNSIGLLYFDLTSGFEAYTDIFDFGADITLVSRTNQTGAFSLVQAYHLPVFELYINKLDSGGSGGGGTFVFS